MRGGSRHREGPDARAAPPPCQGCRTRNRPSARFCRHCGRPLATPAPRGRRRRSRVRPTQRGAAALVVALAALVSALSSVVGSTADGPSTVGGPATTTPSPGPRLEAPTEVQLQLIGTGCRGHTCLLEVAFTDRSIAEVGHRVRFAPRNGSATIEEVPAVPGTGGRLGLAQTVAADDVVCVQVSAHARGRSQAGAPRCVLVTDEAVVPGEDLRLPLDLAVGTCARPGPGQALAGTRPWLRPVPCGPAADVEVYRRSRIPRSDAAAAHCRADAPGFGPFQAWWGRDGGILTVVCAWRR